jgi:hypothetical protein
MALTFIGNYVTVRPQFTKVKVERWSSLVIFFGKNEYVNKEN